VGPEPKDDPKPPSLKVVGGGNVDLPAPKVAPPEHEGICVADGYFLYATDLSQLVELLQHLALRKTKPQGVPMLQDEPDYQDVLEALDKEQKLRKWSSVCARHFGRTDQSALVMYELLRTNTLKPTDSDFARALFDLLDPTGDGSRPFDMSKLPPHAQIRRHLAPAGSLIHAETAGECPEVKDWSGWLIVNLMLR